MKTFAADDQFELHDFSLRFLDFLRTEHYFVESGLVVSLNGSFGTGKTTFLEMWRSDLSERSKGEENIPIPIVLNAWESDFCGDPLLSLVSALSEVLSKSDDANLQSKSEKVREAAKDAAWFTVGLAGKFASHLSGIDPAAAGEYAERKKKDRKSTAVKKGDLLEAYEKRVEALRELKKVLSDTFGGRQPKALIMVDELDRCRPSYAIDYLETIKHVFNIHGLVFVLAVDKPHLRSSAKALFGSDLNFDEYYRKFAHRNIDLPVPTESGIRKLVDHYAKTILEIESEQFNRLSSLDYRRREANIAEVVAHLKLTPRQIHEMFRLMGHASGCLPEQRGQLLWCYGAATILLAALSVGNSELYHRIGRGIATADDLISFVKRLGNARFQQWWGAIIYTGYQTDNEESNVALLQKLIGAGVLEEGMADKNSSSLAQFIQGWNRHHSTPGLQYVYGVIEGIKTFTAK